MTHAVPADAPGVSARTAFESPWLTVRAARLTGADADGRTWYYVVHPGCAQILPITATGRVLLIRSWRIAVRQWCVEAPAGRLEPGDSPATAARRELAEEVGATGGELVPLGPVLPSSGSSTEVVHLFAAIRVQEGPPRPHGGERIEPFPVYPAEAVAMAADGRISDGPTVVALLRAERLGLLGGTR
ncbi:NUDIX hydrolase [Saccharopolyspora sp. 5N708]|uniref:NUDIX hydrolase n=1 Tax=Saccharopolyspora sp. 5N708 TaxID=3457424 RepID=UPI003FCF77BB